MEWAERIDTMVAGYRNSCILIAALKTGIFEALGDDFKTPATVAAAKGLDERAVDVVMCALTAAEILVQDGDKFALDPGARPYLIKGSPETMVSILGHNRTLLKNWVKLEDVLKTGEPVPRGERTQEELEDFICGMENVSRRSSEEVASRVDFSSAHRLLDLGGGPGTAALIFARANPKLKCVVFDQEGPVEIARKQILAAGLEDRVSIRAGDFHNDDYGQDFDVVYISNIIHMLSPVQTLQILTRAGQALVPGGRVLVKDFFLDDSRTAPAWTAQFSVNMLVSTQGGKSYTLTDMSDLLARAGFGGLETLPIPKNSLLISAKRES